jgi:uncharacterized protein (TIGR00251 family)
MDVRTLFEETDDGPVLRLHVQPGAGRTQVTGTFGSALKVRVAAPPEGGRANAAVLKLLAERLDLPESSFELTTGDKSRAKRVLIRGAEPAALVRTLEDLLEDDRPGGSQARKRP